MVAINTVVASGIEKWIGCRTPITHWEQLFMITKWVSFRIKYEQIQARFKG